jgi:hypothetical protein
MITLIKQSKIKSQRINNSSSSTSNNNKRVLNKNQMNEEDYESINDLESFGCLEKDYKNTNDDIITIIKTNTQLKRERESSSSGSSPSQDNNPSTSKAKLKKLKTDNSSISDDDNDDDDDDDDNNKLLIIEPKNEQIKDKSDESSPQSPVSMNKNVESCPQSPSNDDSATTTTPKQIPISSKVIPLNKIVKEEIVETSTTTTNKPSLFDLISKMQENLVKSNVSSTTNNKSTFNVNSLLTSVASTSTSIEDKYKKQLENSTDFKFMDLVHENVNYDLWTLPNNNNKPFKILIRSSFDGMYNNSNVVLHSKLEYQPQFGCEKLSDKDYCTMWCKSFIRNMCNVFLCRINVFTSKLISISTLKHCDILPMNCSFNPNLSFIHFASLLNKFSNELKSDCSYLLVKDSNESLNKQFQLFQSIGNGNSKNGSTFDLHFYYTGFNDNQNIKRKDSYWLPIDPELYLPYHRILKRIPCLFEPSNIKIKN